jgi:predicted esterase
MSLLVQERIERQVDPAAKPVVAFIARAPSPGLIVALHGTGGDGPNFARMFPIDKITAAGYIIAFPTSIQGAWSTGSSGGTRETLKKDLVQIRALLDSFNKEFKIHPDKIHFIGYSAGGLMSCTIAGLVPDWDDYRIRSACAHSGATSGRARPERAKETTVWVLNGSEDKPHLEGSKAMCQMFKDAGYDATHTTVPGKGHGFPLVPWDQTIAWWMKLDAASPEQAKLRRALDRAASCLNQKNYGQAYLALQDAKAAAADRGPRIQKIIDADLKRIEDEAKRILSEAAAAKEKDPAKAKKLLKEMSNRFAKTPYADRAAEALSAIP